MLALLPLLLPDGARGRVDRALFGAGLTALGAWVLGAAATSALTPGPGRSVPNPIAVPGSDALAVTATAEFAVVALLAVASLIGRTIVANVQRRRRLLPLVAAASLVIAAVLAAPALGLVGAVLQDLSVLLVPVACLVSVLRLRLYDLEVAIGRSVVGLVSAALLIAAYVAIVEFAGRLLHLPGVPASVIATALVALAFAPVRAAVHRRVNRWLYGERGDPSAALAATTRVLAAGMDPQASLERAVEQLGAVLRCPGACIRRNGFVIAGRAEGAAAIVVPLRLGDHELAVLEALPRSPGERYSAADERLLAGLAAPLAAAVAAVLADQDLRDARSSLARSREEERRRLRRQLHDDIGPSLAAVAVQAQIALKRLARQDTGGAADAVEAVSEVATRAAADLRRAVDALGPPRSTSWDSRRPSRGSLRPSKPTSWGSRCRRSPSRTCLPPSSKLRTGSSRKR